jgi:hypothetical protein
LVCLDPEGLERGNDQVVRCDLLPPAVGIVALQRNTILQKGFVLTRSTVPAVDSFVAGGESWCVKYVADFVLNRLQFEIIRNSLLH